MRADGPIGDLAAAGEPKHRCHDGSGDDGEAKSRQRGAKIWLDPSGVTMGLVQLADVLGEHGLESEGLGPAARGKP